jgi:hypothetical protein
VATRIPARLSVAEGRRFGLTVGVAFAVLGLIAWWRGNPAMGRLLGGGGAVLMTLGIVAPTRLGPAFRFWMGLAAVLNKITTPVFMAVVWVGVITPTAIVRRLTGKNALVRSPSGGGYWIPRIPVVERRTGMERQF